MMDWLRNVVQDRRTERFIMALIVLNAVTLGLETSQTVMAKYGQVLVVIDRLIIGIFVAEILARLAVQRASFFRDGWNIFYRVTQPGVYAVIDAAQRVAGGARKTNRRNVAAHNCSCPQCSSVETAVT
jgi:hypothetical protein